MTSNRSSSPCPARVFLLALGLLLTSCTATPKAPSETVFTEPVDVVLPTTQIAAARDATTRAESSAVDTIARVDAITPSNLVSTKPEAAKSARDTLSAVRLIYEPLTLAAAINEVAQARVDEARGQTEDARRRLLESEKARAVEREQANKAIERLEQQVDQLRAIRGQWLGYSIAGLGVLCLALGAIGLIGQKFIKLSFGAGVVGVGLIGIGLAVVNYAVWVSIIGVVVFVAFIVGGTIYFVRRGRQEDANKLALFEAGKAIAKSVEAAVDVVDDFNLTAKAKKVMKSVQSATPLAERIVDEAQIELGKKEKKPSTSSSQTA